MENIAGENHSKEKGDFSRRRQEHIERHYYVWKVCGMNREEYKFRFKIF